jgi:NADH-quinone oxidoreductase subunit C
MDTSELARIPDAAALLALEPGVVLDGGHEHGEWTLRVDPPRIRWVAAMLKHHRGYLFLSDLTAIDRFPAEPRFEVIYHLLCHHRKERLRLKCSLSGDAPSLDSVSGVWRAANWCEREVFDLFGIRFAGHPNLRRILMPKDWTGHPLRRDYPVKGYRSLFADD